jgi:MoaA/NifB/PqqE/SkfB family radical SAM enzyme
MRLPSPAPYPPILVLELTTRCQLECIMCSRQTEYGRNMNMGHMNLQQAKRIIDESHQNVSQIVLTIMGETLLYPHLEEITAYIKRKNNGLQINLATNASLPRAPQIVETIADKIDSLMISIDGMGDAFEKVRKGSSYEIFIKNVYDISTISSRSHFSLSLNTVVLKENYHQMADLVRLAKKVNASHLNLTPVNLAVNDWDLSYYSFYLTEEFQQKLSESVKVAQEEDVQISYPLFRHLLGFFDNHNSMKSIKDCYNILSAITVTWDGYLVPCCVWPFPKRIHFGNVFGSGLENCVKGEARNSFLHMINKGTDLTPIIRTPYEKTG